MTTEEVRHKKYECEQAIDALILKLAAELHLPINITVEHRGPDMDGMRNLFARDRVSLNVSL